MRKWIKYKPHSFRSKVIITCIFLFFIPTVIILFIYNYSSTDAMKEQALENTIREQELIANNVRKLMGEMLNITNYIQLDPSMNTILQAHAEEPLESDAMTYEQFLDQKKVLSTLDSLTYILNNAYVTILLKNETAYTNYSINEYNPVDLFEEEWISQLNSLPGYEPIWIDSQPTQFKSQNDHSPYQISVAKTLRDDSSHIYGYVFVTILESALSGNFASTNQNSEIMLLNSSGEILSHRDHEMIGTTFLYNDQIQDDNSSEIIKIDNKDYLLAKTNIHFANWNLVTLTEYEGAVNAISTIFNKIFTLQIVLFIVFSILLALILRFFINPLVHLGKTITKVQQGDLTVRTDIKSKDEIGQISRSFNEMLDRINHMIKEVEETQTRKRKAELDMLQAQINPHFLFNVLNSIRMKIMKRGDQESGDMIKSLSKLLRMTIDKNKDIIPFYEEVELITDYINLMNMRQKEKISFETDISPDAYDIEISRFILQPIIENSIIHGFNKGKGKIKLTASVEDNYLVICVEDNGEGITQDKLNLLRKRISNAFKGRSSNKVKKSNFSSLGIANVYERMSIIHGQAFEMKLDSQINVGTSVTMYIPRKG